MTAPLYVVGVAPDKYVAGASNLNDTSVEYLEWLPLSEALAKQYKTDAHFVTYMAWENPGDGGNGYQVEAPRINKPLLPKIRMAGNEVYNTMLVLDYDLPDHQKTGRWTPELKGAFLNQLQTMADDWPDAWNWYALYFTRGGARLVYVLQLPMKCDEFESKHIWMVQEFGRRGLTIDPGCSDWTRLFRLPNVTRDKHKTWEEDYSEILIQEGKFIAAHEYPNAQKVSKKTIYGEIKDLRDEPMPDFEESKRLCEARDSHGNALQTDWFKAAKKRLKGRDCFDTLFTHHIISAVGGRNNTMFKFIGQAVAMLIQLEGTTPQHIFGLFLPAVEQLEPDEDTEDWYVVAWDHILRLWALEDAKIEEVEEQAIQKSEGQKGLLEAIIHGMREWCKHPELNSTDDGKVFAFVKRRLVVSCGKTYYLMGRHGYYDNMPLIDRQLIPRIKALGLEEICETSSSNADGSQRDLTVAEMLNMYSTAVSEIRAAPEMPGAVIERMDESTACLVVPAYRRNPKLTPEFNEEVDQWLQRFFGAQYDLGCKWIAYALAWDEGITCAMSLEGRQGSGKQLFAQGLSECLEVPATASANDLVSDYQYGLLASPFLLVNEGWPISHKKMHPADSFRSVVGGDPILVNRRFLHPVYVRNPVRVIFTANNLDVVKMLSANRDLSPEDRDALSIRLLHLRIGNEASDYLRMHGGMKHTAKPGKRWVAGTAGEHSDYVVAKHFLWLHSQRHKYKAGARLLVEGNSDQEVMFDMRTQSGASPFVIESLIQMIQNMKRPREGMAVVDGELYITCAEVLSFFRSEKMKETTDRLNIQQVAKVFKGISKVVPTDAYFLKTRESAGRKRWYTIDCSLLQKVAQRDGWVCNELNAIVHEQDMRKRGVYVQPVASTSQVEGKTPTSRIVGFSFPARDVSVVPPQVVAQQGTGT